MWGALRWLRDAYLARFPGKRGLRPLDFRGRVLQHYHNASWRNMHVERIDITPFLSGIVVSVLRDTIDVCITGMEFISDDHPSLMLGYSTPGAKPATKET
ncbi:hypothetical protein ASPWEDRAFT_39173 [Aspergillus wentii DTO 134E9]|uniref:Uncharacterized protein n=1 Tax=Aspergillus wentii DTO 134E9 TaxID=1073089 RepID=A0A1L9RRC8_ASPWE|nr:uncharacterized protein ASPWEDRAFT_39173 [Aspergillus wentii DTO 134E9]OJJ37479.1 hypothetical protein ASPWEDRAFT_39173 [Aspergillus wentii DTO 134E9]